MATRASRCSSRFSTGRISSRCLRTTKSPPTPRIAREPSPRGSPMTSRRTFLAGTCFVDSGGTCDAVVRGLRFVLRRRPPTKGALAIRDMPRDACVRLSGLRSTCSTPVQHQHVVGREIAATSRFCTRTPLAAASTAPGASGSRPIPGAWRGTCAPDRRRGGVARSHVRGQRGAPERAAVEGTRGDGCGESCAVGLPRSVVRCLFEAIGVSRGVGVRQGRRGALAISDVFFTRGGRVGGEPRGGVLGLGVGAIDGLAACDRRRGIRPSSTRRSHERSATSASNARTRSVVNSRLRRWPPPAFSAATAGRSGGSSRSRGARECAGGTSEGARRGGDVCNPVRRGRRRRGGHPVDEYYWEETLLEEWLLGALLVRPPRRRRADRGLSPHRGTPRLRATRHVSQRQDHVPGPERPRDARDARVPRRRRGSPGAPTEPRSTYSELCLSTREFIRRTTRWRQREGPCPTTR